jgi:hypothetical protein
LVEKNYFEILATPVRIEMNYGYGTCSFYGSLNYATFNESELHMVVQFLYFCKIHRENLDLINLYTIPDGVYD